MIPRRDGVVEEILVTVGAVGVVGGGRPPGGVVVELVSK